MIEETGTVVAVDGNKAWVETSVKTTCSSCTASDSCPTTTIAKAFSPKPEHILIDTPCELVVGQQVKIGINESALINASIMIYILPIFALIATSTLLNMVMPNLHELVILMFGCVSSFLCYWWVSASSKKPNNKSKFKPVFLGATQHQVATKKHEIPVHKLNE